MQFEKRTKARRSSWASRSPEAPAPEFRLRPTQILEAIMTQANHPSKYVVREYLERRSQEVKPPPSPEEIRRQLGWGLMMFDQKMESGRS
jgi:hypothetical protein